MTSAAQREFADRATFGHSLPRLVAYGEPSGYAVTMSLRVGLVPQLRGRDRLGAPQAARQARRAPSTARSVLGYVSTERRRATKHHGRIAGRAIDQLSCASVLAVALGFGALAACDFSSKPPDGARGTVAGRVEYTGRAPRCRGDEVLGKIVFLLYESDVDPLLGVQRPVAARAIDGERLFNVPDDCGATGGPLTRQFDFELTSFGPRSVLEEKDYRLVAFWDHDDNFVADDVLREEPNRGDVFGAAYENIDTRRFEPLVFGPSSASGQRITGLVVTIDAEVRSERPLFRLEPGFMPLASEAVMPTDADAMAWEDALFALTMTRLQLLPVSTEPHRSALASAGYVVSDDPPRGFFSFEADPRRLAGELGHPVFSYLDYSWETPFTVFRRVRTQAEIDTDVPNVYLVPLQRPSQTTKEVFSPSMDLLVAPIALVDLNPELPVCRVPLMAPSNRADFYERIPTECQELPTGNYEIYTQHGVAGGASTSGVPPNISDTGVRIIGGEYAGQTWTVPNELGRFLNDQGDAGQFRVIDMDPLTAPDPTMTGDAHGVMGCMEADDPMNPGTPRPIVHMQVPPACCEGVAHLCGLPLCEGEMTGGGVIRQATARDGDRPVCLPFLMPSACCG
jgi:hypothetical protein